jgi:hypothetical protein
VHDLAAPLAVLAALGVEAWQEHLDTTGGLMAVQAQPRLDGAQFEVPPALAGLGPTEA